MNITTFLLISIGILLIWKAAEALEKYAILTSNKFNISPFIIGSTIIALGTSSPEIFTTIFASINEQGTLIIGNVIGSNIANLSLVFGITVFILGLKKSEIKEESKNLTLNLSLLLLSTLVLSLVLSFYPFSFSSSICLLALLCLIIFIWFKTKNFNESQTTQKESNPIPKLISSIAFICLGSWLIVKGADNILREFEVGQMFVGFTVLAIGTSLPEIAASISLGLKGRYEAVAGTLIGSNIFNGLLVMAIPGLFFNEDALSSGWMITEWLSLLACLFIITLMFCAYLKVIAFKPKKASSILGLVFIGSYFIALTISYN
tara:strand:- start:18323 stop:19279 length:957 start_codon:yes stop_codon:yes gene_type:complete